MRKAPARSSPGLALPALSATLLVAGIALAPGSRALAAPSPAPATASVSPAPSQSATMPPPAYSGSAIAATAAKLAEPLRPQARAPMVFCGAIRSDAAAPRAAELSMRIASVLAGALGNGARAGRSPVTLESARPAASGAESWVFVEVELAAGELRATADVYPVPRNVWDRARNPVPGPSAHAFSAVRIDAEVRSFLAPVPLVALRAERFKFDDPEVVALGCEDLDTDGSLDVLAVTRRNVTLGRLRAGKVQTVRRTAWSDLSPIAAAPWREALGSLSFAAAGTVDVGVTDRARMVRLSSDLQPIASLDGMPVQSPVGSACAKAHPGAFFDRVTRCIASDPDPSLQLPAGPFDAWAAARVVLADGTARDVWAARDPGDARLQLRDGAGRTASVPRVGAQVAIADLNLDGDPEIVSGRDVLDDRDDGLTVRTWTSAGAVVERGGLPVPAGVLAVAACPPDGPGPRAMVVATRSELWVVR